MSGDDARALCRPNGLHFEEQVRAGTETVTTGKARLCKWVETEDVNVTVPVSKEKARLVAVHRAGTGGVGQHPAGEVRPPYAGATGHLPALQVERPR
jgi:hypothetical protein